MSIIKKIVNLKWVIELEYLDIKNIFAKGYVPNWSSEIFIVDKINDTVPYTYNLKDLNDEEIIGSFYDKELQKTKF